MVGSTTMSMISWVTGSTPTREREGGKVTGASAVRYCQVVDSTISIRDGVPGPTATITQLPRLQAARRQSPMHASPYSYQVPWGCGLLASARGPGLQAPTPLFHFLYVSSPFYLFSGILVCWPEVPFLSYGHAAQLQIERETKRSSSSAIMLMRLIISFSIFSEIIFPETKEARYLETKES